VASKFQTTHKFLYAHPVMLRYAPEDRMLCSDANGVVIRDDFVVFTANLRGDANVGTFLTGD